MRSHVAAFRTVSFIALFFVVGSFSFGLPTAHASSMTLYTSNEFSVTVPFKATVGPTSAFSGGPTNHFWTVTGGIGLASGDATQYVQYQFTVLDSANGATIGRAGAPTWKWISVNLIVYMASMSAWVGGYPQLDYYINNNDPYQQTFYIYYTAFYE